MLSYIFLTVFCTTLAYSSNVPIVNTPTGLQPMVSLGTGFYIFESTLTANWYGSVEYCRKLGLHLVSIETEEENRLITEYIAANITNKDFWTSGNYLADGSSLIWLSTGQPILYGDWHTGEPNHYFSDAAVMLRYQDGQMKWNDENPEDSIHIICERICDDICNLV